ncbi:hypothetical protein AMTRI_Chr12g266850 [Amborella trichopoda]|uniref:pentatricopeptide repeat-containing protein At4g21190 isoform X2 n=1 Tax=Amborella trichopoda TaxID=13333 RepID=UPI0005D4573C|nr:pentatricopeptide repeat-containing protein At4g21190 isoform X2 [Amborella trichopoda]|eukprot:XP_011620848.1 pentatricopeptide repeat-containing protein At4g21190 isoform X2 [Amborella trichopoda]
MLVLQSSPAVVTGCLSIIKFPTVSNCSWLLQLMEYTNPNFSLICVAKGPRPRYPRVWKTRKRIGSISKSEKLVECIKGLSNVKEEVYGALDSFIAWELEFPLIVVKKALKILQNEKEWKRIIQVTKWMLSKGQGKTMGSYYTLLNALIEDGRLEEAEELWTKIFSENLEGLPRIFFHLIISVYYKNNMHDKMFEVFADMEELGVKPNNAIVVMVGDEFQKLGMLDKYKKLKKKYPPLKWEYRYIKGKRVKILSKNLSQFGEDGVRPQKDEPRRMREECENATLCVSDNENEASSDEDGVIPEKDELRRTREECENAALYVSENENEALQAESINDHSLVS